LVELAAVLVVVLVEVELVTGQVLEVLEELGLVKQVAVLVD